MATEASFTSLTKPWIIYFTPSRLSFPLYSLYMLDDSSADIKTLTATYSKYTGNLEV